MVVNICFSQIYDIISGRFRGGGAREAAVLKIRIRNWSAIRWDILQAICCPIENVWVIWLILTDFGQANLEANAEIDRKMANCYF